MPKPPTIQEFFKRFPDDKACLDYLMQLRHGEALDCPKCGKHGKFHRIRRHPAYECAWCGHEIYPAVGTIFHRSHVPLQKWFYAMYLFTTTRHGVPAMELQRQLGVSYPTALRMAHKIRVYMGKVDGDPPLSGHVEADETYIGGRVRGASKSPKKFANKMPVFGMVQRGGHIQTASVPNRALATLQPIIKGNVRRGSTITTDTFGAYKDLGLAGYNHVAINHAAGEYKRGIHHTNTIEGFWSQLKRSIRGTHVHVSRRHLPKYLGEFEYRYNRRKRPETMFVELLVNL